MMDKRTLWVVVACIAALMLWPMLINELFPPRPKPAPAAALTNNVASPLVSAAETNKVADVTPAVVATANEQEPLPTEQRETLHNDFVKVTFTSHGGGIRMVELLKYQTKAGENVVLNGDMLEPALSVRGLSGERAYEFTALTQTSVTLRAVTASGHTITKQFYLGPDYLLRGRVHYSDPSRRAPLQMVVGLVAPVYAGETTQYLGVDWRNGLDYVHRDLSSLWKFNVRQQYSETNSAPWAAVKNQYFAMILTPATNATVVHYHPHRLAKPADWEGNIERDGISAALEVPPQPVADGVVWEFTYYAGPKEYHRLHALGQGQQDVMQFGFFGFFSVILLKSMNFFYKLIPNYGIAIIIITVLIKLIFWPIQAKSITAMKQMQKFQPLMAKLKEKYKDDPQRQQQELMKLYKEHKINPFASCLPMLLQIPIFFALFTMLRSAVELRGASFLWIKDLSRPDTIFHVVGLPVNPLPLMMTAASIWQMKLTPQTGDPQQQKMMMFLPVIFLFMFYGMSSGLVLYWTVQQLLSVFQQWYSLRDVTPAAMPAPTSPAAKKKS